MKNYANPQNWKYESPAEEGFHEIISPDNSACKITWIYRLNLKEGNKYILKNDKLEMNAALISGKAKVTYTTGASELGARDSFYLPGGEELKIEALKNLVVFIGGSLYEGTGDYFIRKYDLGMPIGDIHQIHGKPPYQREVFLTIAPQDKGSRLICGITYGEEGSWTSWPPHQHTKDLEEVYCYFDIPKPQFALHLASRKAGEVEAVHPVSTGDCVVVPEGYHPTVGMPGAMSCYFWVMAAHSAKSRSYDLAVNDPNYE